MSEVEPVIAQSNEAFHIEVRGFDHIPDSERNMTLRQVDFLWVGTSVNLLAFALGALTITLGLNLRLAILACLVGTLAYALIAIGSIVTVRAGLPVSTLARAAFGLRGNLPNALLSWVASVAYEVINTIFGVEAVLALFKLLGWIDPGGTGKLLAVFLQLLLCGGIAVLGHATMVWFQRFFAIVVGIALLLVMGYTLPQVNWAQAALGHAPGRTGTLALFMVAAGIIASNPISFLFNGPDWVRYLPVRTPRRAIFWRVFRGAFVPSILLTVMGACCATLGDMADPVAGLRPFIPGWLFLIYIASVIGGSLANSVPTYYSSGLTLQALGLNLHRWAATALDVVVSTAIALYVIFVQDFTTALNDFIALLIMWVGPFGGVWIADAYVRRGQYDSLAIHGRGASAARYWGWHGFNVSGCVAIGVGMLAAGLTMRSPLYDGPVARLLGGADLSWVLGFPLSATVYLGLARLQSRRANTLSGAAIPEPK